MSKKKKKQAGQDEAVFVEQPVFGGEPPVDYTQPDDGYGVFQDGVYDDDITVGAETVQDEAPAVQTQYANPKYKNAFTGKIGGVPVITPQNPVQLSPIVVPIAMVPYTTQNQPVLQFTSDGSAAYSSAARAASSGGGSTAGGISQQEEYFGGDYGPNPETPAAAPYGGYPAGAGDTANVSAAAPASAGVQAFNEPEKFRGKNLLLVIMSLLFVLPVVLGYLMGSYSPIGGVNLPFGNVNAIGFILDNTSDFGALFTTLGNYDFILLTLALVTAVIVLILALIGLILNKYIGTFVPSLLTGVLTIASIVFRAINNHTFAQNLFKGQFFWLWSAVLALGIAAFAIAVSVEHKKRKEASI
ncbi:MAG: hypothetical protein LBC13_02130 [Clostridiales bacterium]|jgi:hypothetical protein|nr:hypothetical protein [Clostridiales bacterium]